MKAAQVSFDFICFIVLKIQKMQCNIHNIYTLFGIKHGITQY